VVGLNPSTSAHLHMSGVHLTQITGSRLIAHCRCNRRQLLAFPLSLHMCTCQLYTSHPSAPP
jgi:hypothetical protein